MWFSLIWPFAVSILNHWKPFFHKSHKLDQSNNSNFANLHGFQYNFALIHLATFNFTLGFIRCLMFIVNCRLVFRCRGSGAYLNLVAMKVCSDTTKQIKQSWKETKGEDGGMQNTCVWVRCMFCACMCVCACAHIVFLPNKVTLNKILEL